ncbi:hypothetical protein QN277_026881 [Acacia crassicarpa]|uniref:Uncharacterized protein n=1 Tax=Acacia crassicarpa TaxID=499986 RepID=A0AAE1J8R6_9FABA|nr:hypothetical protein QN277_026881 [Acacia crassicarpa]
MASIVRPGAPSNSVDTGYNSAAHQVQSQPYNYGYPNTNNSAPANCNDLYQNSGTQYIRGLTTQVGIVKGHGNGATVYGSFVVR